MIGDTFESDSYLLDPHGAVSMAAADKHKDQLRDRKLICLATAHPAKFPEQINEILNFDPELPPSLTGLEEMEESYELLGNTYPNFKKFLQDNY